MKKFFILAVLFLTLAVFANAQDIIVLVNGNMIDAKILEILPSEIRYRRFDNLNGPVYVINKNEVYSIRFENGTVEVISQAVVLGQQAPPPASAAFDPNKLYFSLSFDPSGFLMGGPSVTADFAKGAGISSLHASFPTLALNSTAEGFGFGFGGSLNHIWNGKLGGFYLGGLFEWNAFPYMATVSNPYGSYNPYTDSYSSKDVLEETTAHNFIFALNGGYRFVTKSGIFFRTGISVGFSLSTAMPAGFYFKPDIATGYIFGGGYSQDGRVTAAAAGKTTAANASTAATAVSGGFKVDLSKLSNIKNETPFGEYGMVMILLPREALPPDFSKYTRLTITCKYYDANGVEIPQNDFNAMVGMVYDVKGNLDSGWWKDTDFINRNMPVREYNVGGPSGQIHKDRGIKITFKEPPQGLFFQNHYSGQKNNVAFIELTSMVFHNGDYKSE